MRLEVFGFSRERSRGQPQFREATSGFLEEGGHCIYLKPEEKTGENLSVRIRSLKAQGDKIGDGNSCLNSGRS